MLRTLRLNNATLGSAESAPVPQAKQELEASRVSIVDTALMQHWAGCPFTAVGWRARVSGAHRHRTWSTAKAAERANFQLYITELCDAIDVPKPAGTGYEFELPVRVVTADGTTTTKFIDLVTEESIVLEAKDADSGKEQRPAPAARLRAAELRTGRRLTPCCAPLYRIAT